MAGSVIYARCKIICCHNADCFMITLEYTGSIDIDIDRRKYVFLCKKNIYENRIAYIYRELVNAAMF